MFWLHLPTSRDMSLKLGEESPDRLWKKRVYITFYENNGCGQITLITSDEEFKYDTWDIFLSSLNKRIYEACKALIYICTRVPKSIPKNCKYTELELYFTVSCLCCLLCVMYWLVNNL